MDAWQFSWDDGRLILAVARSNSLTAAARGLQVNQSTVSRRLALLEARLEARIFERTTSGYRLTPAGTRILPRLERAEGEILALQRETIATQSQLSGSVRVTGPVAFTSHFLGIRLLSLKTQLPSITLELIGDNRALSLSRREADLAVRLNRPTESYLVARKVGEVAAGLYAAPGYLATNGRPRPGDFAGHDVLGYHDTFQPSMETRWLERHARGARWLLRANATLTLVKCAQAGWGLAILPCYLAQQEGGLERILPARVHLTRDIWLATHRDFRNTARIKAVGDAIARCVTDAKPDLLGRTARPSGS